MLSTYHYEVYACACASPTSTPEPTVGLIMITATNIEVKHYSTSASTMITIHHEMEHSHLT
jgi:hypothetical protein